MVLLPANKHHRNGKQATCCVCIGPKSYGVCDTVDGRNPANSRTFNSINWCRISTIKSIYMDVSKNSGTPKSSVLIGVFHYKLSILGYPHFWKHPHCPKGMMNHRHWNSRTTWAISSRIRLFLFRCCFYPTCWTLQAWLFHGDFHASTRQLSQLNNNLLWELDAKYL